MFTHKTLAYRQFMKKGDVSEIEQIHLVQTAKKFLLVDKVIAGSGAVDKKGCSCITTITVLRQDSPYFV